MVREYRKMAALQIVAKYMDFPYHFKVLSLVGAVVALSRCEGTTLKPDWVTGSIDVRLHKGTASSFLQASVLTEYRRSGCGKCNICGSTRAFLIISNALILFSSGV